MLESPILNAPGAVGVFDPPSSTVGLPFDLADLAPDWLRPRPDAWRKTLQAFHEWAHFYQFATTTYGLAYQMWTRAQLIQVSLFLSEYAEEPIRYRLPLLVEGNRLNIQETLNDGVRSALFLRLIALLQRYRAAVFGYERPPEEVRDVVGPSEWSVLRTVLHERLGLPNLAIANHPDDTCVSGAERYRIDDLLESHAHALSALWLMQAVERFELPRQITEDALVHVNEMAVGPYAAFLRFAADLPIRPQERMFLFCALCDLALNPPGFHGLSADVGTVREVATPVWSPVERVWTLLNGTLAGVLPTPRVNQARYPEWEVGYLAELKRALGIGGESIRPFARSADAELRLMVDAALDLLDNEVIPEALVTIWLDVLGTFIKADRLREDVPLLLGGGVIEELHLLAGAIAGPTVRCTANGSIRIFHRVCAGLAELEIVDPGELVAVSDQMTRTDISLYAAMRKLLLMTREEAEASANERPFGDVSLSLADILSFYGLAVDDFD